MVESDKLALPHNNGNGGHGGEGKSSRDANNSMLAIPDAGPHSAKSCNDHIERASDLLVAVSACADKDKIIDLAFSATEEVRLMAQDQEPLWVFDIGTSSELLNVAEYKRRFAPLDPTLEDIIRLITQGELFDLTNLHESAASQSQNGCSFSNPTDFQASRANGVVSRDPLSLVNMFMDVVRLPSIDDVKESHTNILPLAPSLTIIASGIVDKWSATFSNIVSKSMSLAVLSTVDKESPNGCMQVMVAEFHIPSPLVKIGETYFVRYSRQIDTNTWVVADVSLETILPNPVTTFRRKPSGCLIQALQDGLSMVTWLEHNAYCNGVAQTMFRRVLASGLAFSAKRWISTLTRQCDRIATQEAHNDSSNNLSINKKRLEAATNGLLRLAERIARQFNSNISSNMGTPWTQLPLPGPEEILIKTNFYMDHGVAVTIATSVGLPVKQDHVFNFLRSEHNRNKWDILSHGLGIQEVVRISSARNSTDCVSVVSVEGSSNRKAITYLQESYSDSVADYITYAPVDFPSMNHILKGGSVDDVEILASGFVVVPDGSTNTVLTVVFHIMDEHMETPEEVPPLTVLTAYKLITETIALIRSELLPQT